MADSRTLEHVLHLIRDLPLVDKVRLIEKVAPEIERELQGGPSAPRRSLWGLCADLGPAPSAQEIDQARREAWSKFAHEDV